MRSGAEGSRPAGCGGHSAAPRRGGRTRVVPAGVSCGPKRAQPDPDAQPRAGGPRPVLEGPCGKPPRCRGGAGSWAPHPLDAGGAQAARRRSSAASARGEPDGAARPGPARGSRSCPDGGGCACAGLDWGSSLGHLVGGGGGCHTFSWGFQRPNGGMPQCLVSPPGGGALCDGCPLRSCP